MVLHSWKIFPLSGCKIPELRKSTYHELIVEGYRIVYDVDNGSVQILAVLHGRQSMRKQLSQRRKKP